MLEKEQEPAMAHLVPPLFFFSLFLPSPFLLSFLFSLLSVNQTLFFTGWKKGDEGTNETVG